MTIDEYYAAVKRLGLRPSHVPNYLTNTNDTQNVPDPTKKTPDERAAVIEKLKFLMGVSPPTCH